MYTVKFFVNLKNERLEEALELEQGLDLVYTFGVRQKMNCF